MVVCILFAEQKGLLREDHATIKGLSEGAAFRVFGKGAPAGKHLWLISSGVRHCKREKHPVWRRWWDLNPRSRLHGSRHFECRALVHYATPPREIVLRGQDGGEGKKTSQAVGQILRP